MGIAAARRGFSWLEDGALRSAVAVVAVVAVILGPITATLHLLGLKIGFQSVI